ncbi:MAG: ketosteroid isomerase [Proteobacteria bacterium SG_bin9]|nr:MAG: ketosteroid isomerase [Proteobacteria bacterium SG_bin9]
MTANRACVEKFLSAFYSGEIEMALGCLDDEIDFLAHAPVDILPHLGHRRGKLAVREMWQTLHNRYSHMRYDLPFIAEEGDNAAAIIRVYFRKSENDRIVQMDIADFYRFKNGRIAQIRQFMDSFDVAQQVLERDIGTYLKDNPTR